MSRKQICQLLLSAAAAIAVAWCLIVMAGVPPPEGCSVAPVRAPLGLDEGGESRSPKWPALERHFLATHPTCENCGGPSEVGHHVKPFSRDPSLELDESNLIALCNKHCCHLMVGHLGDWRSYNPNVRADAARNLAEIKNRPPPQKQ